jgi:hypothetical protein
MAKHIRIEDIQGGGFIERINAELERVTENINDINTIAKAPRKITAEIVVTPDEDRGDLKIVTKTKLTLVGEKHVESVGYMSRTKDGAVIREHAKAHVQQELFAGATKDGEIGDVPTQGQKQPLSSVK